MWVSHEPGTSVLAEHGRTFDNSQKRFTSEPEGSARAPAPSLVVARHETTASTNALT